MTEVVRPSAAILETLAMRSWPALDVMQLDGWLLRASNGYTKRANSINALRPPTTPLKARIEVAEKFYEDRALPTIFRLTPLSESDLDSILSDAGYQEAGASVILHLPQINSPTLSSPGTSSAVEIEPLASDPWIDGYAAAVNLGPAHKAVLATLLSQIAPRSAFARIGDFAFGRATVEAGYVGLYSIATRPSHRNKGYGRQICDALLNWGAGRGFGRSYISVEADNMIARQLYESMGFQHAHDYHYRIRII